MEYRPDRGAVIIRCEYDKDQKTCPMKRFATFIETEQEALMFAEEGHRCFKGRWLCHQHYLETLPAMPAKKFQPFSLRVYASNAIKDALMARGTVDIFGSSMTKVRTEEDHIETEKREFFKLLDKQTKSVLLTESKKERSTPLINFLEYYLTTRCSPEDEVYVKRVTSALERYKLAQSTFEIETSSFLGARVLKIVPILKKALDEELCGVQKNRHLKKLELFFTHVPEDVVELLCCVDDPDFLTVMCGVFEFTERKSRKIIEGKISLRQYYDSIIDRKKEQRRRQLEETKKLELIRRANEIDWKLYALTSSAPLIVE